MTRTSTEESVGQEPSPQASAASTACRDVVLAFHRCIDTGRATAASDLFTGDATLEVRGQRLHGRAEIGGFLARREANVERRTRHVLLEWAATLTAADQVSATALVAVFVREDEAGPGLERIVDVEGVFLRGPDRCWRLAERRSRPVCTS